MFFLLFWCFFLLFQNFDFSGCWGAKGTKNGPKWPKILSVALHISGTIHHMTVIYGTYLSNDYTFRCFFHFSKILIFWVHRGVKGQKMVQNDKKFCLLPSISQESYIIWLSFIVHICKMIISSGVFFHFSKILIFWVHRGVKGQKMVQNDKKFCLLLSIS